MDVSGDCGRFSLVPSLHARMVIVNLCHTAATFPFALMYCMTRFMKLRNGTCSVRSRRSRLSLSLMTSILAALWRSPRSLIVYFGSSELSLGDNTFELYFPLKNFCALMEFHKFPLMEKLAFCKPSAKPNTKNLHHLIAHVAIVTTCVCKLMHWKSSSTIIS